jgi:hypothetical protein
MSEPITAPSRRLRLWPAVIIAAIEVLVYIGFIVVLHPHDM